MYRIAGNFWGRQLSRIGRKGAFPGENLCGMLTDRINGCGMPKISWRKLSRVAVKSWNSWRFSPGLESFPLYDIRHIHYGLPACDTCWGWWHECTHTCTWGPFTHTHTSSIILLPCACIDIHIQYSNLMLFQLMPTHLMFSWCFSFL